MTRVDCDDCTMNFQTKKLYIKHLKSKECTRSKHSSSSQGTPASKKPRLEGQALNESLIKVGLPQQNTAQYSQKQMEVLQSQITQLSQKQKELLQAQITQKQRQVLQAIPYNQLSEKQKEILKRLSASKPASPTTPTVVPTTNPTSVQIRPTVAQVSTAGQPSIKKGRRKNVYNKIPELKNGQIVRVPNSSFVTKAPEPREPVEAEPLIKEFVFSDDPIAAESIEIAGEAVTMVAPTEFVETEVDVAVNSIVKNPQMSTDQEQSASKPPSKVGSLKIKPIANAFQEISNIVAPTATPKETCPHCKKIFSKAGMSQHIETRHKIQCGYCELRFLQEELNVHIQDHMAPCSICKDIVVKDSMDKHVEMVHNEECSKCKVKFLKTELKDHVRNIHEPEGCDECESRFETKDVLKVHVDSIHLVEKCDECAARFKTVEELESHVVEVHPKEYCEEDECDAVFGTLALLDEHKEKVHPNPNKFVSFNGGMFMMMMTVQDEEEEKDEEELETEEVVDSKDRNIELEEAEKAATYQFFEELVIETAHNVVKTAMTGKILFALRFEEEGDVDE